MFSCCFHHVIALCVIVTKPNRSFERGNCLPEGSPSSKEATHIASDGQSSCQYHFTASSPHWPVVSATLSLLWIVWIYELMEGMEDCVLIKPMSSKVLERKLEKIMNTMPSEGKKQYSLHIHRPKAPNLLQALHALGCEDPSI